MCRGASPHNHRSHVRLEGADPLRISRCFRKLGRCVFVADFTDPHVAKALDSLSLAGAVVNSQGKSPGGIAEELSRFHPTGITTFSESCILLTAAVADLLGLP
ncbi:hypothetical protein KEM60_00175 [Austwickia sp. TVS 96-490-7B]|nr:hypothetical protein [Austwickia sp. TVS 96-490-7B]